MMPLMYAILKDAKADLEEAARRIDEGWNILFSISYIKLILSLPVFKYLYSVFCVHVTL